MMLSVNIEIATCSSISRDVLSFIIVNYELHIVPSSSKIHLNSFKSYLEILF